MNAKDVCQIDTICTPGKKDPLTKGWDLFCEGKAGKGKNLYPKQDFLKVMTNGLCTQVKAKQFLLSNILTKVTQNSCCFQLLKNCFELLKFVKSNHR